MPFGLIKSTGAQRARLRRSGLSFSFTPSYSLRSPHAVLIAAQRLRDPRVVAGGRHGRGEKPAAQARSRAARKSVAAGQQKCGQYSDPLSRCHRLGLAPRVIGSAAGLISIAVAARLEIFAAHRDS